MSQVPKNEVTVIFWDHKAEGHRPVSFIIGLLHKRYHVDHLVMDIPPQLVRNNNTQLILEAANAELKKLSYPKRIFHVSNCICMWGMHWRELTAEERIEEVLEPDVETTT